MSGSVNKVILVGNLGKDVTVRDTNGGRVAQFSVATSEGWKDKQTGEWRDKTEWHNIVIWNEHLVKVAEKHLRKGSKVYIEGALQTRSWDKEGVTQYTTEVVLQRFSGELTMLDSRTQSEDGGQSYNQAPLNEPVKNDFDDDSIPF